MTLTFRGCDLPNPYLLTAPENLEYMREMEKLAKENAKPKKATAKRKAAPGVENDSSAVDPPPKRRTRASVKKAAEPDPVVEEKAATTRKKAPAKKTATASKSKEKTEKDKADVFSVSLDGDEDESVEIYDSCDEIRRKIRAFLMISGETKAAFLRDIARAGWPAAPPKIQSKQLTDFLDKEGATSGSTSRVFYGAYVYFEKKRILEKKAKSAHRLGMEDRWDCEGGLPRERPGAYLIGRDQTLYEDEYGAMGCY